MRANKSLFDLGNRERQIVETVYRLGEASVAGVLAAMSDPPSYSTVRTMLGMLVRKKVLRHRRDGKRYLYRAIAPREQAQKSALRRLLGTLFGGQATDAMAALLDVAGGNLSADDLDRMRRMIDEARKENR